MMSKKPRKQRKKHFNEPLHRLRKSISAHLEENLLIKYNRRAIPVVKGDTVKIMRGSFKGHEEKIAKVDVKKRKLHIEGITLIKADGNKIPRPIDPSNVLITKLNLTDKWRRRKLEQGVSEEIKKEIEKEAEEQVQEVEEQKRKEEEQKETLKKEEKTEPPKEETVVSEEKTEKPPVSEVKKEEKQVKKPAEKTTMISEKKSKKTVKTETKTEGKKSEKKVSTKSKDESVKKKTGKQSDKPEVKTG